MGLNDQLLVPVVNDFKRQNDPKLKLPSYNKKEIEFSEGR